MPFQIPKHKEKKTECTENNKGKTIRQKNKKEKDLTNSEK